MARYRLIGGDHQDKERDYRKGDIVESDIDLLDRFPNKFQLLTEDSAPAAPVLPALINLTHLFADAAAVGIQIYANPLDPENLRVVNAQDGTTLRESATAEQVRAYIVKAL